MKEIAYKCVIENLAQKITKDAIQLKVEEHQEPNNKDEQHCEKHAAPNQQHHAHVLHNVLIVPLLDAKPI